MEVASIPGDEDESLGLRGCGNQTISIARRFSCDLPFGAEVCRSDRQRFIKRQDGKARKHLCWGTFP